LTCQFFSIFCHAFPDQNDQCILHPDLTDDQIKLITCVGFKRLSEAGAGLYEKFIVGPTELSPIKIKITRDTSEKDELWTYIASGVAPIDCTCIFVKSFWSRRVFVKPGKPFSFTCKLQPGCNPVGMFSVDEEKKKRKKEVLKLLRK